MAETMGEVNEMANQEHSDIRPDLSSAELSRTDLSRANFSGVNLFEADLSRTTLVEANLRRAGLSQADLSNATLVGADLRAADLNNTDLTQADLRAVDLRGADLREANLDNVIFGRATTSFASWSAYLREENLEGMDLGEEDFGGEIIRMTVIGFTIFGDVDLSTARGLDTINHTMPSTVGIDTIIRSKGKFPTAFLKNAGVPNSIIEAIPSLFGSLEPIQYYKCFISYSSKDQEFAERLYTDLQSKGVRCWFAPEDLKIGEEFPNRIEEAIRLYDKLLVVLSEHSVKSSWVEDEVRAALEKEGQLKREQQRKTALFPIKIDNAIEQEQAQWVALMRRKRHIGDFTRWKRHDDYQRAFERLLRDLKAE